MTLSFKIAMEACLMPLISLFGLLGNAASICVLHHRDVKLKKEFVQVLSALAAFDILFLVATFFLFTMPTWNEVSEIESLCKSSSCSGKMELFRIILYYLMTKCMIPYSGGNSPS